MRKITLTTPITMPDLPGSAAGDLTEGKLGDVTIEIGSRSLRYGTCLEQAGDDRKHGIAGDLIQYDQLDAAGQAVVDAMLDLVLDDAQAKGHIPAGAKAAQ